MTAPPRSSRPHLISFSLNSFCRQCSSDDPYLRFSCCFISKENCVKCEEGRGMGAKRSSKQSRHGEKHAWFVRSGQRSRVGMACTQSHKVTKSLSHSFHISRSLPMSFPQNNSPTSPTSHPKRQVRFAWHFRLAQKLLEDMASWPEWHFFFLPWLHAKHSPLRC